MSACVFALYLRERRTDVLIYLFVFLISGDNQDEKERNSAIKAQIQEELRRLEDEIAACKWTRMNKVP